MGEILGWLAVALSGLIIVLLIIIIKKLGSGKGATAENAVRNEFRVSRQETADDSRRLREEVAGVQKTANEAVVKVVGEIGKSQQEGLGTVEQRVKVLVDSNESRLDKFREMVETQMKAIQAGNELKIEKMQEAVKKAMGEMEKSQQEDLGSVEKRVKLIADSNETRLDKLRETVDSQMKSLQDNNEKKLEQMRQTVDEKLQNTLEKRLGESFALVSERLEAVQRGLGDMQNLATGVGDLKRMLTNVKARGIWGESQIGDILEQILTPDQFDKNVQPKAGSGETVEYAIRLPGQGDSSTVWLPIDSKFPQEDYQRLVDAAEIADSEAVKKSTAALIQSIQNSAKDITAKYIDPPQTTDFAIMFLPTEGLYAEVLRQPGLVEKLQQQYRVLVAGPTILAALLNSLRVGFRTLAIEKRSSEVWKILSAVKTEFGKFGEVLSKVKNHLDKAANTLETTGARTRAMERKLRSVEEAPTDESTKLLSLDVTDDVDIDDEEDI